MIPSYIRYKGDMSGKATDFFYMWVTNKKQKEKQKFTMVSFKSVSVITSVLGLFEPRQLHYFLYAKFAQSGKYNIAICVVLHPYPAVPIPILTL